MFFIKTGLYIALFYIKPLRFNHSPSYDESKGKKYHKNVPM
jgi:hypothetical protein